ncbi:unnamed protein product [Cladocopium goreaui]|uniref:Uncharacterized protein n=1 Tax=Cladocopium goreaui TaxID=2562237 RepID=A0A9P1BKW4_9DINO|nr:unnamed protein product [Cladocopium goreaui]
MICGMLNEIRLWCCFGRCSARNGLRAFLAASSFRARRNRRNGDNRLLRPWRRQVLKYNWWKKKLRGVQMLQINHKTCVRCWRLNPQKALIHLFLVHVFQTTPYDPFCLHLQAGAILPSGY